MNPLKRTYLGLPEGFNLIVRWAPRSSRMSALSYKAGGFDIVVEYHDGKVFGYDRIKYPSNYIEKIYVRDLSKSNGDFVSFDESNQLILAKRKLKRIFVRECSSQNFDTVEYKEVWNSDSSKELPWIELRQLEKKTSL